MLYYTVECYIKLHCNWLNVAPLIFVFLLNNSYTASCYFDHCLSNRTTHSQLNQMTNAPCDKLVSLASPWDPFAGPTPAFGQMLCNDLCNRWFLCNHEYLRIECRFICLYTSWYNCTWIHVHLHTFCMFEWQPFSFVNLINLLFWWATWDSPCRLAHNNC